MIDACLKDKIVLITGANYGIGVATAVAFAKENAKVFFEVSRHKKNQL
ncbi:MAG: SDR family NAD(P)-dependent oxidoreductase [Candidatus Aminicenantaceae bacterium]